MNLCSKKAIKQLLKSYGIFPSKRLGQNFLIDKNVLREIINAANLSNKDVVLEIGSGLGTLTLELAKKVKKVVAVEKDPIMCEILEETLKDFKNVEIIQGDILKLPMNREQGTKNNKRLFIAHCSLFSSYKVVANIPYYMTSRLIRLLLETKNPPKVIVLIVQKEVAQRICSKPPRMNLLAVSVQFFAQPKIIDYISKNSFWPQPKVDSALIKIVPIQRSSAYSSALFRERFFRIVKAGFSHPRKKLVNNLAKKLGVEKEKVLNWLKKCKIKEGVRAENLSLEDWLILVKISLV